MEENKVLAQEKPISTSKHKGKNLNNAAHLGHSVKATENDLVNMPVK